MFADNIIEKEIDGVLYRARFLGIAYALDLETQANGKELTFKVAEMLFRDVLISPNVEIDDFPNVRKFTQVYDFLFDVANGINASNHLSKAQLKQRVHDNWAMWRLVLSKRGFDYPTVFGKPYMTPQDVLEANYALSYALEMEKMR